MGWWVRICRERYQVQAMDGSASAGRVWEVNESRRLRAGLGRGLGWGGRGTPAAQPARSNRRHLAKIEIDRLASLVGTRVEREMRVCIWHDLDPGWHVRC